MKNRPIILTILCCVSLLSCGRAAPAAQSVWPADIQRGANVCIFPGWPDRYSEEDIAHLALDWRANSVRVLVNDLVPNTPPYQVDDSTRADFFKLIDYCLKYRLYTVIAISTSFGDMDPLFTNDDQKAAFRDFWVEIAERYVSAEGVAYDLYNEPHGNAADTAWSGYARELTDAILSLIHI